MKMASEKLYIIGNGFDLHHKLKTHYYDFANYLKDNDPILFESLANHIAFPDSDANPWRQFESNLAHLDVDRILDEHTSSLPDYASDSFKERDRYAFPGAMQIEYENYTTNLFNAFKDFILAVEYHPSVINHKIDLDNTALFLQFNYTETLERIYNIKASRILYIHNSAYHHDNIVLGHGTDPLELEEKLPEPPDNLSSEELERWYDENIFSDYSYDEGKKIIRQYFTATYKPTKDILKQFDSFFAGLKDITEINVYGHSIAEVDRPYFSRIVAEVHSDAQWNVSYLGLEEKERHLQTLLNLGIDKNRINQLELTDLQIANQQLKINFPT